MDNIKPNLEQQVDQLNLNAKDLESRQKTLTIAKFSGYAGGPMDEKAAHHADRAAHLVPEIHFHGI